MVITTKLPSSSSRTDPPDVLLEGMVGTPEDHIQALNEATTKMLQDSTPERVAEIAGGFQGPELVHAKDGPFTGSRQSPFPDGWGDDSGTDHQSMEELQGRNDPQEAEQDPANEGNDSTQVAAETDYIWCASQQPFSLSAGPAIALFGRR